MAEPFKNFFNPEMITLMSYHLHRVWGEFDQAGFIRLATHDLESLELKQRSNQIMSALETHLPSDFAKAAKILTQSLHPDDDVELSGTTMDNKGIRDWAVMPMSDYVGKCGLDDFELGMSVQKELTKRFSSEFGIRPFIIADPEKSLEILTLWARNPNYHVRRLVSEGSRPRLPWGMRLPVFIENPDPLLPILEMLKDDRQEYVRRSVANNLNDISKDHPDKVSGIAGKWLKGASPERQKLVRHACRSLIKKGHRGTLTALGYQKPEVTLLEFEVLTPTVTFGEALRFKINLKSSSSTDQNLIIDYVIHHQKANGKTSPKVFKWKTMKLTSGKAHQAEKKHMIRPITTRVYYPGKHQVEIIVNGDSIGIRDFELKIPKVAS